MEISETPCVVKRIKDPPDDKPRLGIAVHPATLSTRRMVEVLIMARCFAVDIIKIGIANTQ